MAMRTDERRPAERLRELAVFADCTDHDLDTIQSRVTRITVRPGTVLMREGDPAREAIVILDGSARVSRNGTTVAVLGKGDVAGEMGMIERAPRNATVEALTPLDLLVCDRREFGEIAGVPEVASRFSDIVTARRADASASPQPAERRLAAATSTSTSAPRRRRRRRVLVASLTVLALVAGAATVWVLRERHRTTVVSQADVLSRFRSGDAAAGASGSDDGGVATAPEAAAVVQAPAVAGRPVARRAVAPAAAAAVAPTGTRAFSAPAEGVYTYATKGYESISALGGRHEYPDRTHSSLRHSEGCGWTVEHMVIKEHVDRDFRCSEAGRLLTLGDGSDVEFFGQRDGLDYMCSPPGVLVAEGDVPGTTHESQCRSEDGDRIASRATYAGRETLDVGGQPVITHHVVIDFVFDGRADGTAHGDFWYDAATGLMVQEHRQTDTDADAAFGKVHYSERASFKLLSLTPQR